MVMLVVVSRLARSDLLRQWVADGSLSKSRLHKLDRGLLFKREELRAAWRDVRHFSSVCVANEGLVQ